ncbi:unnamed protein product [Microthlaspi erraticum]|uniref:Cyclin-like domain-containing protein n=1 Tax=Microthlaspi erraticum TaxID=1685480 RepID=A0A6D2IE90_9BRAS|nr:unnamed protein product [Microthlaspi erraticum]
MANTSLYCTREEIEANSPSRVDGIDIKQETFHRWSYSTFLQELGQRLKVPQKTIATSIVLCQRFFTRQSLAKNDAKTISMICLFIAGKLEGSPKQAGEVIAVGYRILHNKEPSREAYEKIKGNVFTGEKLVLSTLGFDLEIEHPYEIMFDWVKRTVKVERDANRLYQAALNFVNDGLRTSLCLQFKPNQIAAAALYLGSSFVKVKLPCDGEKVWWQEFDVTKRHLGEISDQTLAVYEQDFLVNVKDGADSKTGDGGLWKGEVKLSKDDESKSWQGLEGYQDRKGSFMNGSDKSRHVANILGYVPFESL